MRRALKSPKVPLRDVAYNKLRDAIRDGKITPDARVREEELARWLNMSRTPVRDALRRLTSEGLLSQESHRKTVVTMLDYQAVTELYAMREALEGIACAMTARLASSAEIAALYDILETEPELYNDLPGLLQLNARFHHAICQGAHNRFLMKMLPAIRDPLSMLNNPTAELWGETTSTSLLHRHEAAHKEHLEIVRAIEKHDPALAEEAARAHVRSAQRERLRLMHELTQDSRTALFS
ncbi:MAG TPA: GntR family transcriptional regulator [Burkholderiales bacterium]|nr:GntR family transcriptional regulator [Burkholderiales bacterium]